jgi:hypothetical protein
VAQDGWQLLRGGSGPGAVVAVDFTVARGRHQATFTDLAPGLPAGYQVWGTHESCWPAAADEPRTRLARWLGRAAGIDAPVCAVLGFCAGASLATALSGRIGEVRGTAPPVILYDPAAVTARTLLDRFDASLGHLAALADEAALRAAQAGLPDDGDLDALATLLAHRYAAVAEPACAGQGVPPSVTGQLCLRVATNLRYLALCGTATADAARCALLVVSREHEVPPGLTGAREVRLDAARDELLAHSDAARATAAVLTGDLAAEPT